MKIEDQNICGEPGCRLEMLWLPEIGFFCRNAKDHELAALRSKCEELEKRNEELEQKIQSGDRSRAQLNEVAVAFHHKYAFPPKMAPSCIVCGRTVIGAIPEPNGPAIVHAELPGVVVCYECRDARARLSAAESRAQEAETKLRAAEDVVVVLTEALKNLSDWADECVTNGKYPTFDSIYPAQQALSNTSALAAQRKRGIQREALRDYGHHKQAIPELGVEGCDYDPEQGIPCTCGLAAMLNPEGPDANTEDQ